MPSAGYEGIVRFVLDQMTTYGLNACPPLLIGVGVATSVETAALLSKKALMRSLGTHNPNERAAKLEALLTDAINAIGSVSYTPSSAYTLKTLPGIHLPLASL